LATVTPEKSAVSATATRLKPAVGSAPDVTGLLLESTESALGQEAASAAT